LVIRPPTDALDVILAIVRECKPVERKRHSEAWSARAQVSGTSSVAALLNNFSTHGPTTSRLNVDAMHFWKETREVHATDYTMLQCFFANRTGGVLSTDVPRGVASFEI